MRPAVLRLPLAALVSAMLATGCVSSPRAPEAREGYAADGAVSAEIVDAADGGARYQPMPGSSYLSPLPMRENAKPEYPPALLDRRLPPAMLVVRLIVDGAGKVADARIIENASAEAAFAEAVLAAVRGWTFFPLKRVTGRQVEPLPFTQDYRFTFRQVNGRAVVDAGG
ncbi:TonB family protein [Thermomonas brevis]